MSVVPAPCGTWASPLSAAAVAAATLRLSSVAVDGDDVYWVEGRPSEGGRYVLVRRRADGRLDDVTPPPFNVRSRVHEYGGGAFAVAGGAIYFSNDADQRLYAVRAGAPPSALTPAGPWRYADLIVDSRRSRLLAVREDHAAGGEPVNTLVGIPLDRAGADDVLASGADFYSTPRLSPDGAQLAWLSWRHPQMPWDGTELWIADVTASGSLAGAARIAGGPREAIYQPGWGADGTLYYVSDRTGWWSLYRADGPDHAIAAMPDTEFGVPQWTFGTATWAPAGPSRLVVASTRGGTWSLARLDLSTGVLTPLAPGLQPHEWLAATPTHAVLVAGSSTRPHAVIRVALDAGGVETLREAASPPLEAADVSTAEPLAFPTRDGDTAHAFYYAPRNGRFTVPSGEAPPLIVISHGGPTAAAASTLNLHIQYWTTRGFAVADVNYRGSSGYGRAYRERLNGQWGIVDVADVIDAARALASRRPPAADGGRLIIRGGSAGGYTTLAALTFHPDVFRAGASYYGISDLEVLETDTHKFESRYSASLIGPYPEARDVYHERSPIHFIDRLSCPLVLFQGLEDKVVPPNQSAMMADAVRAKGLPVAYLAFAGEQHGFRQAATIVRCLEAELYFYGQVFGFAPADRLEPVALV